MPLFKADLVESLTRRQYWLIVAGIMLVLIGLCVWAGFYQVRTAEDKPEGQAIEHANPMEAFAYTPLGNAIILGILQFIIANALLWGLIWVARRVASGSRG